MTIDDKIRDRKLQYDIYREAAKIAVVYNGVFWDTLGQAQ